MEHHVINDLAICILAAWILAVGAKFFQQPLILAYLVAGFVVGPVGIGLVQDQASIETISEIGLILLLFMVGLEIDLKKMLGAGRMITLTAGAQILGGCALGLILFRWLGFPLESGALDALYLAVGLALSSTVIIVKVLYDKRELDTLAGRLTLGILVLQDVFAILFLAVQPNLNEGGAGVVLLSLFKAALLVAVSFVVSRYALPPIFQSMARLPELVLVGALAWCFLVAGLAGSLKLSREMGALVAGISISTFPYTLDVVAKVTSLRDFFVTLFFVALGMAIPAPTAAFLGGALLAALFLIASRFLTVFPCLYKMQQGYRASLLPALNLCQVSELSLVIFTLGSDFKHVSDSTKGIVTYTFVVLAVVSTYAMMRTDSWLRRINPWLTRAGLRDLDDQTAFRTKPVSQPRIFILGFSWTASSLLEEIIRHEAGLLRDLVVIDFNPNVHRELRARGVAVTYGDIAQRETLQHAKVGEAEIIVCTLPNTVLKGATNLRLLQQLREINPRAQIIVHAELLGDVPKLYAAGADYVAVPRLLEAQDLCKVIRAARQHLLPEKRADLDRELANRNEVIP